MYELLYGMCVEQDCDIAICSSEIHYNDKTVISSNHPFVIHDRNSAMKAMLEGIYMMKCGRNCSKGNC